MVVVNNLIHFFETEKSTLIPNAQFLLVWGMLFTIPTTASTTTILAGLLILVWFWEGDLLTKWEYLKKHPLFWGWMAYIWIYPLSLLWTENSEWTYWLIERHFYFLIFPVVLTTVKKTWLPKLFMAFVLGMTVAETFSYLLWFEIIQFEGVFPGNPVPFVVGHTIYNPLLAWALYLLMSALFFEKINLASKVFLLFFAITMTINMFITGGRGGQLAYFFVVFILFVQFFSMKKKMLKGIILGFLFVSTVFFVSYNASPLFKERVQLAINDIETYSPQASSSWGVRLDFYINTIGMSLERPLLGSGFGDFPDDYNEYVGENAVVKMETNRQSHIHPHNQFLYELGALGLVGLSILLYLVIIQIKLALKAQDRFKNYKIAFAFFIPVILMPEVILNLVEGIYLFVLFSAILFSNYKYDLRTSDAA